MVGVHVVLPRRQADVEAGRQLAQGRGELRFEAVQPGVGQAEPDHLGRAGAKLAQRCRAFGAAAHHELAGIGLTAMRGLAIGHGYQPDPDANGGQQAEDSPGTKDLVVGVRRDHHHAGRAAQAAGRQLRQARPRPPGVLPGPGRIYRVHSAPLSCGTPCCGAPRAVR